MTIKKVASALPPMVLLAVIAGGAQNTPQALAPLPAPFGVPKPGPSNNAPYTPLPILPDGLVLTLYPPGSPYLNRDRAREAEQYDMSQSVPGRINSIVNIHNPSVWQLAIPLHRLVPRSWLFAAARSGSKGGQGPLLLSESTSTSS